MNYRARPSVVLSLIAALVLAVGCGSNQPEPIDPASQDPRWAEVIDSHTSGLVSKAATIRIRFADDVIAEERVGDDASESVTVGRRV